MAELTLRKVQPFALGYTVNRHQHAALGVFDSRMFSHFTHTHTHTLQRVSASLVSHSWVKGVRVPTCLANTEIQKIISVSWEHDWHGKQDWGSRTRILDDQGQRSFLRIHELPQETGQKLAGISCMYGPVLQAEGTACGKAPAGRGSEKALHFWKAGGGCLGFGTGGNPSEARDFLA